MEVIKNTKENVNLKNLDIDGEKEAAVMQNSIKAIEGLSEKEKIYAAHWLNIFKSYGDVMRLIAESKMDGGISDSDNKIGLFKKSFDLVKIMEDGKEISQKRARQVKEIIFTSLKQLGLIEKDVGKTDMENV